MPSKLELWKDVAQVAVDSGAEHVGRIASVITGAVREVTREVGEWASDVFEVIDAAQRTPEKPAATSKNSSSRKSR